MAAISHNEVISHNLTNDATPEEAKTEVSDYVADEMLHNSTKLKLDGILKEAKFLAIKAAESLNIGNRYYYRHGVKMMFLFHEAKGSDYLETLIKEKARKTYKATVNHGFNFAPIIDLVWHEIQLVEMPLNKANRLSRALNHLYKIWGEKFSYNLNAEDQLVAYIVEKGGINGLVKYSQDLSAEDLERLPDLKSEKETLKEAEAFSKVSVERSILKGMEHYRNARGLPSASFQDEILVNEDSFALLLVEKKPNSGYFVVDNYIDSQAIGTAIAKSYLGQVSTLPRSVRFLIETLSTQCCPADLGKPYKTLIDEANKHSSRLAQKAFRRLVYKHAEGTFLLSNTFTKNGLITVARPRANVLDQADSDVALSAISRRQIEKFMIGPRDYQSAKFKKELGDNPIPSSGTGITHAIRASIPSLTNSGKENEILICFHKEPYGQYPLAQADVKNLLNKKVIWERQVSREWFKQFNSAFTKNWICSHGRHIDRAHQSVLELIFRHASVTVNFFNLDNKSDLSTVVPVSAGSLQSLSKRVCYLSKDFAVAMIQLGEMNFIKSPWIRVYPSFMQVACETDVGSYEIYVPTSDSSGIQDNNGVSTYTMSCNELADEGFDEDTDNEFEGDL